MGRRPSSGGRECGLPAEAARYRRPIERGRDLTGVIVLAASQSVEAQQLRMHCLCGDELRRRGDSWSAPLGPVTSDADNGTRTLRFRYRSDEEVWSVEIGRHPEATVVAVLEIIPALPLSAGDRRWRALASRLGPVPEIAEVHRRAVPLAGREIVAARRAVHPSHIVDRLMMRDRAMAMAEIETLLFGCRPQLETLLCA